jgi:hypothetical protein
MASNTRQEILRFLQEDWANYVQDFHSLSPQAQSVFLARQGYARFADLLAHLVAWWKAGHRSIEQYITDPASQPIQYDVDDFNARAVAEAAGLEEEQVVEAFEKMRHFWIETVKQLPDDTLEIEKVVQQLEMEFIGHLGEHRITELEAR